MTVNDGQLTMAEPVSLFIGTSIIGGMIGWAVSKGLDPVAEELKGLQADRKRVQAFESALDVALDKFKLQYPDDADRYFNPAFLEGPVVSAELAKLLTVTEAVNAQAIAGAIWTEDGPPSSEVIKASRAFLGAVRSAIGAQDELAKVYDRRQLQEVHASTARTEEAVARLEEEVHMLRRDQAPEAETLSLASINAAFGEASELLLGWPQQTGGEWIQRPELDDLQSTILVEPSSRSVILGAPGCGKSALLAHLGNKLKDQDVALLALKVDEMPRDIGTLDALATWLKTPGPVDDCIRQLAQERLVILLVDQLDAVGELIDVHTGRLTALLALVNRLKSTPNVHIILSCRRFDYEYDVRFQGLKAKEIALGDLPWEEVEKLLRAHGCETAGWSEPVRRVLQAPQHLRLFIDHLVDAGTPPTFDSYHTMLEAVFKLRFRGPESGALLETIRELALRMAESEELWQPRARFDQRFDAINRLVALGFLQESPDHKQIGFTHQTVFDFVRARAFVQADNSLAEYVAAKHCSLNVRPTLWSALHYMRAADPAAYRDQLNQVWGMQDLRVHVRLMLIAFLGLHQEPRDEEAHLLMPTLDDPVLQEKTIRAVGNSQGWFQRLLPRLPAFMRGDARLQSIIAWLLGRAVNFDKETVLGLIEEHWLNDKGHDNLTLDVLRELGHWDDQAASAVLTVLGRSVYEPIWVRIIAEKALASRPDVAAQMMRAALDRAVDEEEARTVALPPEPPEDASVEDEVVYQMACDDVGRGRFEKLVRNNTDWYNVPKWAASHPAEFLSELWPWYLRIARHLLREHRDHEESYIDCDGLTFELEPTPDRSEAGTAIVVVQAAVVALAEQAPDAFLEFAKANQDSDMKVVHCLLVHGFATLAAVQSQACLDYLLGDPRRLSVGSYRDKHRDTKALISALYPHLNDQQRAQLDGAILSFAYFKGNRPDDDADIRHKRIRWNQEHRLRVLRAVSADLMSPETKKAYDELERAHPNAADWDFKMGEMREVTSPMSADQMAKAQDAQVLNLFSELTDDTGWDHPRRIMGGGSVEASRALEELAKQDPTRAIRLLPSLEPGKQERPAGHVVAGLNASEAVGHDVVVRLVHDLHGRGFVSEDFRWQAARCLESIAKKHKGLDDETCALLASWLAPWQAPVEEEQDEGGAEGALDDDCAEEGDKRRRVIWGQGFYGALPHGNYPTLDALQFGYLCREPKAVDPWLDILEAHLDTPEDPAVWQALAPYLRYLRTDDITRAVAFLDRLFKKVPDILLSRAGMILLANVTRWLPKDTTWEALQTVLASNWSSAGQGVGEVLFLCYLDAPTDEDYGRLLEDIIEGRESGYIKNDRVLGDLRSGVAASCAHQWSVPECRELSSTTLHRVLMLGDDTLAPMIMDVFSATPMMPVDEHTRLLLKALPDHPACLYRRSHSLIESLKAVLADGAFVEEVCVIVEKMLDIVSAEIANMKSHWVTHGEDLVEIAVTLQRFEVTRDRGLTLFERLMETEGYFVPKVLQEIDRRIGG